MQNKHYERSFPVSRRNGFPRAEKAVLLYPSWVHLGHRSYTMMGARRKSNADFDFLPFLYPPTILHELHNKISDAIKFHS